MPSTKYDYVVASSVASIGEMAYHGEESKEFDRNHISLQPGESKTVVMAWIVNEPDLGNLYLNLKSYTTDNDVAYGEGVVSLNS